VELGLDLKDNAFLLVTVGRLVARKGLPELLDIVRELGDSRFQLVVIGEGPERENLEEHARSAGIADRVRFTGFVSDERKWQILENADLYVSTSIHEGFGIVFLEAMESGLPVQCYDRGGQVDFVTNEVGRILPLGDVKRFRDEILFLSRNAEARRSLSDAARGVAAEYSIARYAESYRALYTQCMVNANRNSD
jgi:1,4-alpha-glucan branching enzyme